LTDSACNIYSNTLKTELLLLQILKN